MTAPQTPGRGAAAPSPKAGGTAPAGSLTALRTLVDAMHTVAAETAESSPPQAAAQYWWPQAAQYWWTRYEALGDRTGVALPVTAASTLLPVAPSLGATP